MAHGIINNNNNKKILFLVSSMQGGGAERVATLLCNHWVSQGYEVTLMPTYSGRGCCIYRLEDGVKLDYLADHVTGNRRGITGLSRRFSVLRNFVKSSSPDVIVSFMTQVNIAALLVTRGLNTPVVISERIYPGLMPLSIVWRILRKLFYRYASVIVVQSRDTKEWMLAHCPGIKVRIIPNPLVFPMADDEPKIEPDCLIKSHRKVILSIGRLDDQKQTDKLLEAFLDLAGEHTDWDLVIVGEGGMRVKLEEAIWEYDLNKRVIMPGRLGNVADWYKRADIFVLSSKFEGMPNTLIEAMAHGVPAVSFNCKSGPSDIIQDGINGLLVDPEEGVKGLGVAIERLIKDERLRNDMAFEASKTAGRYSIDKVAAQWDDVLHIK